MISIPSSLLPLLLAPAGPDVAAAGDKLPPGPPWHVTWREARRDALRHGRPLFAYFTKTV